MNNVKELSVAVLLINYNQWEMTIECVKSIKNSDYPNFRIFLMDNGSGSEQGAFELKKLESTECEYIRFDENKGYVGGMNYGLQYSSNLGFDLFLIMNNDTIIDPMAISALVDTAIRNDLKCIVTGKVYHYDKPRELQHIGYEFKNKKQLEFQRIGLNAMDKGQWDEESEMDMIDDIFWLLPNSIYRAIGGYSNYFWFNAEQTDFALRAIEAGNKLIYTPQAKLWHKGSMSIGGRQSNPKLVYFNTQANLIFRYLHLSRSQFFLFYTKTIARVFKGYIKLIIKFSLGREVNKLSEAEFKALQYFHRWIISRKPNTGYNPFN